MSGKANRIRTSPRVAARQQATRGEILEAAWQLAREQGLNALTLRDLGARVGMKAQSLYSYFDSKHAIYDAMFRDGYQQYLAGPAAAITAPDPSRVREQLIDGMLAHFDFCNSDPVRFQLLFQRTIPGFEPSADSMAVALTVYERTVGLLRSTGLADDRALDLWTAVATGLPSQQIANDPGGTRWRDLVPAAIDMLLTVFHPVPARTTNSTTTTRRPR